MRTHALHQPTEHRKIQIALIVVFLAAIIGLLYLMQGASTPARYQVLNLADNWDVEYHGRLTEDCSLDEISLSNFSKGDTVTLTISLPDVGIRTAGVVVMCRHAAIHASFEGEEIFSWGDHYSLEKKLTPTARQYIPLPDDFAHKELTITMIAGRDGPFSGVDPILLGNIDDLYTYLLQSERATVIIGVFLLVLFFSLLFVYLYLWFFVRRDIRIFFSGLVSVVLGTYMLSYYDVLQFFTNAPMLDNLAEYVALFLLPSAIALYIASIRTGMIRRICLLLAALDFCVTIVVFTLYVTRVMDPSKAFPLVHGMMLGEGVFILVDMIFRHFRVRRNTEERWETSDKVLLFGLGLTLFLVSSEIVRYNLIRMLGESRMDTQSMHFVTLGALVFVVSLLLNVFYYNLEHLTAEQTKTVLEGLAYTDPLTEIANRGRCEQIMDEIAAEGEPFTVISFDVDDLKLTNDTYSHAEGDRLLIGFSEMLQDEFEGARLIGRMGGDEFIVILPDTSQKDCEERIARLEEKMRALNATGDHLQFSASYGVAYSHEKSVRNIRQVLSLADERMYRMKVARHKERRSFR